MVIMKRLTIIVSIALVLITVPVLALAHCGSCDHEAKGGQMMAAKQEGHEGPGGMSATGSMLDLGTVTVKGVAAMGHMKDVRAAMGKMGMKTTHHFMIMFKDEKTGTALETGKVAVKINGPDGSVTGPMELMGMQGHFGADLILDKPGEYRFEVGSKLTDGETRQFEFKTTLK
jgi:hypothetical protein